MFLKRDLLILIRPSDRAMESETRFQNEFKRVPLSQFKLVTKTHYLNKENELPMVKINEATLK